MDSGYNITWVGFKIPWAGGRYNIGMGVIKKWVGRQYIMGRVVKIPWAGGSKYHGLGV